MSSNKDLYLAFRGQIFEALDAEAVQKMSRRDLESQIQAAVDLLANSYQRPITSMMKSGFENQEQFWAWPAAVGVADRV